MTVPVRVTFRNVTPSRAVEARIRREVDKLSAFYAPLQACEAAVEAPHRHRRRGFPFRIRLVLGVPGEDIVVDRRSSVLGPPSLPQADGASAPARVAVPAKDVYAVLREAFGAARRRLTLLSRRWHRSAARRELRRRKPSTRRRPSRPEESERR